MNKLIRKDKNDKINERVDTNKTKFKNYLLIGSEERKEVAKY